MRTVFKFNKSGTARYISHLDLMRTMNRAIRRARLPAAYSQGFHPHIVMAFAQALGLGYLSQGEYMEISLDDSISPEKAMDMLNAALPKGLVMTGAWRLDDSFPTLMAAVSAASWLVEFHEPVDFGLFEALLASEKVDVVKEGKNGPSTAEIRQGIYEIKQKAEGVEMFLAAGSALNIRPELVVKAALGSSETVEVITRLELYTFVNDRQMPFYKICIDGDLNDRGKDHIG